MCQITRARQHARIHQTHHRSSWSSLGTALEEHPLFLPFSIFYCLLYLASSRSMEQDTIATLVNTLPAQRYSQPLSSTLEGNIAPVVVSRLPSTATSEKSTRTSTPPASIISPSLKSVEQSTSCLIEINSSEWHHPVRLIDRPTRRVLRAPLPASVSYGSRPHMEAQSTLDRRESCDYPRRHSNNSSDDEDEIEIACSLPEEKHSHTHAETFDATARSNTETRIKRCSGSWKSRLRNLREGQQPQYPSGSKYNDTHRKLENWFRGFKQKAFPSNLSKGQYRRLSP